jgi:hypothetical protein
MTINQNPSRPVLWLKKYRRYQKVLMLKLVFKTRIRTKLVFIEPDPVAMKFYKKLCIVLHSVADPAPGYGAFLTPGFGIRDG